jgi:hypothetical protein
MDEALGISGELIAALEPAVVPSIGGSSEHAVVLNDGSYRGLVLQRDIVLLVQRELDAAMASGVGSRETPDGLPTAAIDVKLLRAGNEAARDLTRLAVRVAEGAFKAQQGNQLVALLEALKAAQEKKKRD